jgi:hypothetical protein
MLQYTNEEMILKYGKPNQSGTYLVSVTLPFKMKLAWDLDTTISKIRCHKKEAEIVSNIFNEILTEYGLEKINELGIDLFGGCFNYRAMRGSNNWSRHAWGTAIDLDPVRNNLHENKSTARFARPEYNKMIDIFENNNWLSLGRLKDFDWMHFEAGKST